MTVVFAIAALQQLADGRWRGGVLDVGAPFVAWGPLLATEPDALDWLEEHRPDALLVDVDEVAAVLHERQTDRAPGTKRP